MHKKPTEALEFIRITERILSKMLSSEHSHESFIAKPTQITGMLLSNYILSVNLMLSIALKFSESASNFEDSHLTQLTTLQNVES